MSSRWLLPGVLTAVLVVGALLAAILLLPIFLNADSFRPEIETQLSNALGRSVTMGRVSFSLVQRSLIADDVAIADDPSFSNVPFIQARRLLAEGGYPLEPKDLRR